MPVIFNKAVEKTFLVAITAHPIVKTGWLVLTPESATSTILSGPGPMTLRRTKLVSLLSPVRSPSANLYLSIASWWQGPESLISVSKKIDGTEFGHEDPPEFEKYLEEQLGEYLIHEDDSVFGKTIAELLPKRVICVWKPRKTPQPKKGGHLWNSGYLKDNWIDTDLPSTKFDSNLKHLNEQPPVSSRKFFYRVENTATPQADNPVLCVKPVTKRIHGYTRLFITQCVTKGCADKLQILSTDFIDGDFVDMLVLGLHTQELKEKHD